MQSLFGRSSSLNLLSEFREGGSGDGLEGLEVQRLMTFFLSVGALNPRRHFRCQKSSRVPRLAVAPRSFHSSRKTCEIASRLPFKCSRGAYNPATSAVQGLRYAVESETLEFTFIDLQQSLGTFSLSLSKRASCTLQSLHAHHLLTTVR
jgi:hypothetical protein